MAILLLLLQRPLPGGSAPTLRPAERSLRNGIPSRLRPVCIYHSTQCAHHSQLADSVGGAQVSFVEELINRYENLFIQIKEDVLRDGCGRCGEFTAT